MALAQKLLRFAQNGLANSILAGAAAFVIVRNKRVRNHVTIALSRALIVTLISHRHVVCHMKFILNGTAEIVMQPARFKILKLLKERGPTFLEQIAKETGVHPRMVSHHIDVLEGEKLVETKYELVKLDGSKRDVAVRTCRVTSKADEVMKDVRESVR